MRGTGGSAWPWSAPPRPGCRGCSTTTARSSSTTLVSTLPFVVLALTLAIGKLLGPTAGPSRRRTAGVVVSGAFVVIALVNFAWFWPIWTNQLLTHSEWLDRIWFSRWI